MPKTKIICTIGPASSSPDTIRALIQSGMSVARLNFSHGTHADHADKIVG
jgi:pyruvate kinase